MRSSHVRYEPPTFNFNIVKTAGLDSLTKSKKLPGRFSLINAPTGYGKTVLMSALFNHFKAGDTVCFWTCLAETDRSFEKVITRLEKLFDDDSTGFNQAENVHKSDAPIEERIAHIIKHLTSEDKDTFLFIDNLDYCKDETLSGLFDSLIFNTPNNFHVICAATTELNMSLHRIMLEGHLIHYDFKQLAFNKVGVKALFGNALSERLGDDGIEKALRISEGWPAALRMMQIILNNADNAIAILEKFSGEDSDIASLLQSQLYNSFDEEFKNFLLATSLTKSFSAPLCEFISGNKQATEHIKNLINNNLLIIPLNREKSEFRLHSLFRDFLRGQAKLKIGDEGCREILRRASVWCENKRHWGEAIDYALEADDINFAVDCLERISSDFIRDEGDLSTYINWVEQIMRNGKEPSIETDYWYVWALVFHRRYEYAAQQIKRLSQRLRNDDRGPVDDMLRRLEIIEITCATYRDILPQVTSLGEQWLKCDLEDDPFDRATVACATGISYCAEFNFPKAREFFQAAQISISQSNSDYGKSWVDALSSLAMLYEGDYLNCHERISRSFDRTVASSGANSGITSTIASVAAYVAAELGKDSDVIKYLEASNSRLTTHGVADTAFFSLAASIKMWATQQGENIRLYQLREIAESYPKRVSVQFSCVLIQRLLRLRRNSDARDEAKKLNLAERIEEFSHNKYASFLIRQTLIDLDICEGRITQTETLLSDEIKLAKSENRVGNLIELHLMKMSAEIFRGSTSNATREFTRAIGLAAKRQHIRPFRDRADHIAGLVNEKKAKSWGFATDEEKNFFREICKSLPIANSAILEQLERLDVETVLLEPPTPRELELLQLIDAGLTNQQLADRLFVSLATVKWHLHNLYNKLEVSNRSSAIAKSRALNLIAK
ncbi:LuxR C-terminal-related transcriptional regulator [uncultured Zhongshania sp.]|uniref:LuxR C-terminal-related transcriptional regulator n=1 Tax=uncultured Zhongshania sp. TaxID=1642288 RepID=UPI0030DBCED0|tara:strand:+ start:70528 stop:73221 length:2694 start_codon:yes stop_codon:yes gene_type:complete